MKTTLKPLLLGILFHSSASFADCASIVQRVGGDLAIGREVTMMTSYTKAASVAMTVGSLVINPERAGSFLSQSVFSEIRSLDDTTSELATLEILYNDQNPASAQLNYKIGDGTFGNSAFLMTCRDSIMFIMASDGILTATFHTEP
jgi:hypothetical protein